MIYCAIKNSFITWPMHFIGAFTVELAEVVIEISVLRKYDQSTLFGRQNVCWEVSRLLTHSSCCPFFGSLVSLLIFFLSSSCVFPPLNSFVFLGFLISNVVLINFLFYFDNYHVLCSQFFLFPFSFSVAVQICFSYVPLSSSFEFPDHLVYKQSCPSPQSLFQHLFTFMYSNVTFYGLCISDFLFIQPHAL